MKNKIPVDPRNASVNAAQARLRERSGTLFHKASDPFFGAYDVNHPTLATFLPGLIRSSRRNLNSKLTAEYCDTWGLFCGDQLVMRISMELFKEDMSALRSTVRPLRRIAEELKLALQSTEQFSIRYQPIIDGETRQVEMAEALLRWTSPVLGEVLPGRFIQIAEQNGLIGCVTRMVIRKVCEDLANCGPLVVSVNISGQDMADPNFASDVSDILATHGVSPKQVILECTDCLTADEVTKSAVTLRKLRQQGHAVAIYELETGFTSFGFVKMSGYTLLKVDRVLLDEALQNETSRHNLQNAVQASRERGYRCLAFGIETQEQANLVEDMGFDLQQGFYHSQSLTFDDLMSYADDQPSPAHA